MQKLFIKLIASLALMSFTLAIPSYSQEKRFVTFYASEPELLKVPPSPGHAFVSFVREDDNLKQTVVDGVWGLYPVSKSKGGASFLIGEVPGEIRDDFLTKSDAGLTVEVNQQEYNNVLKVKEKWSNANYKLTEKDCLSFVIEIASSLDHRITLPGRCHFDFPVDYILKLKDINKENDAGFISNSLIPSSLCDYQKLLDNALNPKECELLKKLYVKLLGIATELGAYRRLYIENGDLINAFPTVYYHMTVIEMNNIRNGKVTHSIDKMRQMIYFFDAYQYNRVSSALKKEEHWRKHFDYVSNASSYNFCISFGKVMVSAVKAHVSYDLARAIRYAYDFHNSTTSINDLRKEFEATNNIFALAQERALDDMCQITSCASLGKNLNQFLGILELPLHLIIDWRMDAFDRALISRASILGQNGGIGSQPSTFPHDYYHNLGKIACKNKVPACKDISSTLFLFDLSGSMNDHGGGKIPKIEQAKNASRETLDALKSSNQGVMNQVAVYGFAGGCVQDPTTEISPFEEDLDLVEKKINTMRAGGGTPLGNAIRAAECKMAAHLQKEGQEKGRLIILSDGQGTCGSIRPAGVYHSAPLQKNRSIIVDASQCGGSVSSVKPSYVSYYTVGFNIQPGSPAERDLQYLSQISGGKYLNVQNQTQLARAFRKFNRVYQPKEYPALSNLPAISVQSFDKGVTEIKEEYYEEALEQYMNYVKKHSDDCHGVYNLAIVLEANDFLKEAIENYKKYLSLCPTASDRDFVEKQIKFLEDEFREFTLYQKEVVRSDLSYLKLHFERIQNGESVALAEEFKGFLREKGDYYEKLPRLIGNNDRFLQGITEELASALKQCKLLIRRNPKTWDRDAIPLISMSYLNLQDLLDEM